MRRYLFLLLLVPSIFFATSCYRPNPNPNEVKVFRDIKELGEPRSWTISKHIAIIDAYDGKHTYDTTITYPDTTFALTVEDKYSISIPANQYFFAVDNMPYQTTTMYYGQVAITSFSKQGSFSSNVFWDASVIKYYHKNMIDIYQQVRHQTSISTTTSGVGFDTLYSVQASWSE